MDSDNGSHVPRSGVSVIIPTHNRAFLIARAIKSVLNQTYPHFELVVVDDCSIDNTRDIVNSFGDKRIHYIRLSENRGVSASRNNGMRNARNKYLAFLDDDDEWLPAFLEKGLAVMEGSNDLIGVAYADLITEYGGIYRHSTIKKTGDIHRDVLRLKFDLPMQSLLIKAGCFQVTGLFDEDLATAEDIDMVIRLSQRFDFIHVGQPLVIRHATAGSLCSSTDELIRGFKALLSKHAALLERDRQALSQFYLHIGHLLFRNGQEQEARQYISKAVGANPLNFHAAASFLMLSLGRKTYNRVVDIYMNWKYPRLK